ncbi:MAG: hypothetical protein AABY11_01885, partial [archaeon]
EISVAANEKKNSLGSRIERMRNGERRLNDAAQNIEEWKKYEKVVNTWCEEKAAEVGWNAQGGGCAAVVEALENNPANSESAWGFEKALEACVSELNEIGKGKSETEEWASEWFTIEFGLQAGVSACESQVAAAKQHYFSSSLVSEWMEWKERVEEEKEALDSGITKGVLEKSHASLSTKAKGVLEKSKGWPDAGGVLASLEELEEVSGEMQEVLLGGVQKEVNKQSWRSQNAGAEVNESESTMNVFFEILNPYKKEIELSGPVWIPIPFEEAKILNGEAGIEWGNNEVGISEFFLGTQGKKIEANGKAKWITASWVPESTLVLGTTAFRKVKGTLHAHVAGVNAQWEWEAFPGTVKESAVAMHDGIPVSTSWQGPVASGKVEVNEKEEVIHWSVVQEKIISVSVVVTETSENGVVLKEYEVTIQNKLEDSVVAHISTGILSSVEAGEMIAFDESGTKVGLAAGPLGEWVVQKVTIPGMGSRMITMVQTVEEDDGDGVIEKLEFFLNEIKDNASIEWAAEAHKLSAEVKQASASNLPGIAQKVSALKLKVEMEKTEEANALSQWKWVKEEIQKNGMENDIEVSEWWTHGEMARVKRDWKKMMELAEKIKKKIEEKNKVPAIELEGKNELSEERKKVQEIEEKIGEYKKGLSGVSCAKLVEVQYYCPINEERMREMTSGNNANKKEIE